jgi:hypothetical protein
VKKVGYIRQSKQRFEAMSKRRAAKQQRKAAEARSTARALDWLLRQKEKNDDQQPR